jgi:hypothetical protein
MSCNLIVLTVATAMLGTMQFALAVPHQPFHCWTCCPPTCDPGEDAPWKIAAGTHVATGNAAYTQHGVVSQDQLLAAAKAMVNFIKARIQDGTILDSEATIEAALTSGYWKTILMNALTTYEEAKNFKNVIPQSVIQDMMNSVTQADRDSAAWGIKTYGLVSFFYEEAAILTQFANAEAMRIPGQKLLFPVKIPPGWARVVFDTLMIAGTVLIVTDPIGWIVVIGGYVGNEYMNANGMSRVKPFGPRQAAAYLRKRNNNE